MAGKPLSWKWKLTIGFVVAFIFLLILAFTPWGCNLMRDWLQRSYDNCPADERREHWAADWWMKLAFWEGWICGRKEVSQEMYLKFIGIAPAKDKTSFQNAYTAQAVKNWNGFYDPKTKTGWGVLHPRAPEAYYNYLELEAPYTSPQQLHNLASFYPTLFWTIYGQEARSNSPHQKFYIYWTKTRIQRMLQLKFGYWTPPPDRPPSCDPPEVE